MNKSWSHQNMGSRKQFDLATKVIFSVLVLSSSQWQRRSLEIAKYTQQQNSEALKTWINCLQYTSRSWSFHLHEEIPVNLKRATGTLKVLSAHAVIASFLMYWNNSVLGNDNTTKAVGDRGKWRACRNNFAKTLPCILKFSPPHSGSTLPNLSLQDTISLKAGALQWSETSTQSKNEHYSNGRAARASVVRFPSTIPLADVQNLSRPLHKERREEATFWENRTCTLYVNTNFAILPESTRNLYSSRIFRMVWVHFSRCNASWHHWPGYCHAKYPAMFLTSPPRRYSPRFWLHLQPHPPSHTQPCSGLHFPSPPGNDIPIYAHHAGCSLPVPKMSSRNVLPTSFPLFSKRVLRLDFHLLQCSPFRSASQHHEFRIQKQFRVIIICF